jgi:hypothetical protein
VASHVRSLMATHLTDVPSSDHHTVKPWSTASWISRPSSWILEIVALSLRVGSLIIWAIGPLRRLCIDGGSTSSIFLPGRRHSLIRLLGPLINRAITLLTGPRLT